MSTLLPELDAALDRRLALRLKEAAFALGISERKLREMLPELPHVRHGSVVLFPVESLREWLRVRAEAHRVRCDAVAGEILEAVIGNND